MRVCFIANQIAAWGKIGGFGVNLRRLGGALVQRGIEVHVVVPRRTGQSRLELLDGMHIHGVSWAEIFCGSPVYRQIEADIYHLQEPNLAGWWVQSAVPKAVHLVTSMDPRDSTDWWTEFFHATWQRRLKAPAQWFYEDGPLVRRAVRRANGVYVEAECLREKTRRHYGLTALPEVLPKPVPIPNGPFTKSDRPLCVFLARLDPRKRPEMFLEIARLTPDFDFVLVGRAHDASYQRRLEALFSRISNLRVTGFLDPFDGSQMFEILSRAWVLVHPAMREGLATAFQEASVHEMAILAQVDPGGYVTQFGNVMPVEATAQDWSDTLREFAMTGAWREKGQSGRQYNIQRHSIEASVERHLQVYADHVKH